MNRQKLGDIAIWRHGNRVTLFKDILNGRLFVRPNIKNANVVWIKLNINKAQYVTDENTKCNIPGTEEVIEVFGVDYE